jgi:SAM-dependent methyltransferase
MAEKPNEISQTDDFEFEALREAVNYRRSLVREFAPHLSGDVAEVGAGIGQITSALSEIPSVRQVVAYEPEPRFCLEFKKRLPKTKLVEGIFTGGNGEECDGIVCVNVLEHIREDDAALASFRQGLSARKGKLCLFVPARQEIYAPIDRDFGHHRRYTKSNLRKQLDQAGFQILRLDYYNLIGYFAWWLNFKVRKQRKFEVGAVRLYDRMIFPVGDWLERSLMRPPIGQSLLAIAQAR